MATSEPGTAPQEVGAECKAKLAEAVAHAQLAQKRLADLAG